ncbi:glutaredoxin-C4-like [Belonocnema kinseyi]|uniref:glutaredoxin-C4-like n=1 Tax=Belonocnema kinseyi TaxID=2817044 RepID=UPI00143D9E3F|nr:glutaredoxin-C4-like [Belonocnema kinseyi]XP_033211972.1 glutaredoxin-C4-like [Belonocnema kinseyi]
MTTPKEIVVKAIEENNVVIFSKKSCPFCKMAKDVFKKMDAKFAAIEIDDMDEMSDIQDVLGEMTGARTVPRVFLKGKFIGGGSDVKSLYESGELVKML